MDGQISGTNSDLGNEAEVDPWLAAFEALDKAGEEDSPEPSGQAGDGDPDPEADNGNGSIAADTDDGTGREVDAGGLGDLPGEVGEESETAFSNVQSVSEDDIAKYEEDLSKKINDQAIHDIAAEFVKRGIRNRNGVLGATIDDPDICKRDEDGVPRFYNPETGREFTGDNPRRQAQEWVEDYNKELARVFNEACGKYEAQLKKQHEPSLAVMKFVPKYEKLDDIRKGMLDNVIEDYEIRDKAGKIVGYSCDLDKALALVERQIAMIQQYAKSRKPQEPPAATGPALDMKTSSGAVQHGPSAAPKSLAEAMEWQQDQLLAKLRK